MWLGMLLAMLSIFSVRTYTTGQTGEKRPVDLKSDRIFPVPVGDSTGYALVGNVILYHNGAVITCDSMVRYDARHMDCFGNVVINQDSLYVYGDRVEYDGDKDLARVFSPLIKMTDGNAVMYTYNFSFNTRTNVGEFSGGGTVSQDEYLMEARRGYYYADSKVMVGVGDVLMRNAKYLLSSDSVSYNLDTEQATFHKRSNIWNDKGEILSADAGDYFTAQERYRFYSNAYILTEKQELWADSLDYASALENIEMWNNIQALDTENNSMAFGDYARYIGESGKGLLTRDPSILRYELEEGTDTLYMRADSIYVYEVDSLGYFELNRPDSVSGVPPRQVNGSVSESEFSFATFSQPVVTDDDEQAEVADEEHDHEHGEVAESAAADSRQSRREARAERREEKRQQRSRKGREEQAAETEQGGADDGSTQPVEEEMDLTDAPEMSEESPTDVATEESAAAEGEENTPAVAVADDSSDNAGPTEQESPSGNSEHAEQAEPEEAKEQTDRVVLGYRNVKIFRKDFQAVCDSLLGFSADSTIEMHVRPVLWSEDNQITSDDVQVFTERQQLKQAVFTGNPIMASQVDTMRYNQVNGKTLTALFEEGAIVRVDVNGNVKTYYYLVDDSDDKVQGFLDAESADLTFEIEDNKVVKITFRSDPIYTIYPMDQIPADNNQRFAGFEWYGNERPKVEDILNREIRPSEREHYTSLPRPDFVITERIDNYRERIIDDGWADRDDTLTEDTIYFITTREP